MELTHIHASIILIHHFFLQVRAESKYWRVSNKCYSIFLAVTLKCKKILRQKFCDHTRLKERFIIMNFSSKALMHQYNTIIKAGRNWTYHPMLHWEIKCSMGLKTNPFQCSWKLKKFRDEGHKNNEGKMVKSINSQGCMKCSIR